ncbi:MAG: UDP-N-acetylmuramoyl-L-alanyl-D-glutamate--2,6-diaminopimelate ligase, partial [Rubrivivax sp.]|nr:UDP-N-acetylmuramoyl-L-alanyl-D-glutamate--2,6-diaminopimelate ligase [Rubrivivax sp.]
MTAPAALQHLPDAVAAVAWLHTRLRPAAAAPAAAGAAGGAPATLRTDSRDVQPGDAFIAWPGATVDGRRFVPDALRAGAAACLVEAEGAAAFDFGAAGGRVAALAGLKAACGAIADAWFGQPSRALDTIAVTGTNGKTSTTWWAAAALGALGRRAGVIGTLGVGEPPAVAATGLTTPDPVTLHATLRRLVDAGCRACALEASSIGLVEQRLAALKIDVAVFTNFTRDHLDFHGTMAAYWAAKRRLFDWPGLRAAVVNIDDPRGAALAGELDGPAARARAGGAPLDLWTFSVRPTARPSQLARPTRLVAQALRYEARGLAFEVVEAREGGGSEAATLASTLVGDYNASNLLGVLAALRALGVPLADAVRELGRVGAVPGRLQRIAGHEVEVVVDYAHTPDALEKVLATLRPLAAARGGRLTCVFGCGGDRDATKRALMGGIAERGADRVVVTSDNPRSEAPRAIMSDILAGMSAAARGVALIEDRREAIATAVAGAAPGDVVLLAGKGHEDYQEIAGVRRPFSDVDEARAALARRDAA